MKKIISVLLAALLVFSFAACANTNNENNGGENAASVAESALELMNKVWGSYADDEKFPVGGGDFSEENATMDGPGKYGLDDAAAVDATFGLPESAIAMVDDAASMVHMMNANTFTAAAFHAAKADDAAAVVTALKDNISSRQWVCGFPEKLVIITVGDYVVSAFGAEVLIDNFKAKVTAAYDVAQVSVDEAIA